MPRLKLHDQRMISLMECIVNDKAHKAISSELAFLKSIGLVHMNNFYAIKRGDRSFSLEHFIKAIEKYSVSADFFFYKSAPLSFHKKETSVSDLLRSALLLIDKK